MIITSACRAPGVGAGDSHRNHSTSRGPRPSPAVGDPAEVSQTAPGTAEAGYDTITRMRRVKEALLYGR